MCVVDTRTLAKLPQYPWRHTNQSMHPQGLTPMQHTHGMDLQVHRTTRPQRPHCRSSFAHLQIPI